MGSNNIDNFRVIVSHLRQPVLCERIGMVEIRDDQGIEKSISFHFKSKSCGITYSTRYPSKTVT